MDYDDDGIEDFISGSYDPGDVYLFRGLGEGKYAAGKGLVDENDVPLVHHPSEMAKYQTYVAQNGPETRRYSEKAIKNMLASFGSWAAMVDWDDDGDLDVLIGTFKGELILRTNIGSRSNPVFAGDSQQIESDNSPLKEASHTNPVVADWDGDGLWDLVVGSGNGSVSWYRNVGSKKQPKFGARNELVGAASKSIFALQYLSEGEQPMPGARAQICVTDYNDDGLLDLIVGDHSSIYISPELDAAKSKQLNQLISQQLKMLGEIDQLREEYGMAYQKDPDSMKTADFKTKLEAWNKKYEPVGSAIEDYFADEPHTASFVWLYTRKSAQ